MRTTFVVQTKMWQGYHIKGWFDIVDGICASPDKAIRLFRGMRGVPRRYKRIVIRQEVVLRTHAVLSGSYVIVTFNPEAHVVKTGAVKML